MAELDREVLGAIAGDVLAPDVIEEVVHEAHELFGYTTRADVEAAQRREMERLEREQARLTDAVAAGAAVHALVARLQDTERRRIALASAIEEASGRPQPPAWATIERRVRQKPDRLARVAPGRRAGRARCLSAAACRSDCIRAVC